MVVVVDKIVQHVQTNEPDTIQYQVLRNSEVPNELTVWEEVSHQVLTHLSS